MQEIFARQGAEVVMGLQAVPDVARYGSVTLGSDGRVKEFVEKGSRTGAGLINAGVYLLRREIVSALPANEAVSLERDVFPRLLGGKVYGLVYEGIFIDIGIPADLEGAQTVLLPKVRATTRTEQSRWTRPRRSILPLSVRGSDFRNSIFSGTM